MQTRPWRGPRGQATVEFALIFPVFLMLTIGVVDIARISSTYIAVIDGVREAALFAADGPTNNLKWCAAPADDVVPCPIGSTGHEFPDPDNIAFQMRWAGIDYTQVVMEPPVCVPDPCVPGSKVTIAASYRVPVLTPGISNILGGTILMSVTTTAKVLQ